MSADPRKEQMSLRHPLAVLPTALALALLTGCATGAPATEAAPQPTEAPAGHGEVEGAAEVPEPPLALVSIDAAGAVGSLDLLDGTVTDLGEVPAPQSSATDGRYVFAGTADGVSVIDSGVWTWDHVDHFHYYRAEPSLLGDIPGEGPVSVSTGLLATAGATGLYFSGSREAVLLDNAALSKGRIEERLRIQTDDTEGVIAPLGDGALIGAADALNFYDADGTPSDSPAACDDPAGSITTRVGLVVGCADGAVLATVEDGVPVFERIPYPEGGVERALAFDGRKGRPTVAGPAGEQGFWLLDTRERSWQLVPTPVALERVVAVDDEDGHVVALDEAGRVRVFAAESGSELAATEPVVDVAAGGSGVALFVDGQRAYVNDPGSGVVHEIAYADGARIARTLETPTDAAFFAEVGR
jgi:hypothetical protein